MKKGLDDWCLFLGVRDTGGGKAACLLPEAHVISKLPGCGPEGTVEEMCREFEARFARRCPRFSQTQESPQAGPSAYVYCRWR